MQIYVDADACPVVDIVEKIAKKYQISVTLLCDTNHILTSGYSEVCKVFLPLRLHFGFFDKNCGVELETLAKKERALSGEKTSCKEGLFVI